MIYSFFDPHLEAALLGAKAKNLRELFQAGFSVPPGFVLTEPRVDLDFSELIQKIGGYPVAVRSSGSLEDLPGASFAGLYETFLFVNSHEELRIALKKCFDSKDSDRVKDYLKTKNIAWTPDSLTMSVLVQKMVDAEVAGVLFTLNPTNGFEEESYIEYCQGVGERLVSGHVTPSRCRYNWMEEKKVTHDINDEGTILSDSRLKELAQVSAKIQAYYGCPQDIEWAIDKSGKLYILQARPITSYTPREDMPEVTNADFKDGGVSARVCTPFMFSLYREAMQPSMGGYLKSIRLLTHDEGVTWIYNKYGRAYWNAEAVKEGLKKLPGFREEDFDRDLGIQKDYGQSGSHYTKTTLTSVVEALPVLLGLHSEFQNCETMVNQFRDYFENKDAGFKEKLSALKAMSSSEFKRWFLDVMNFQTETERNYFRTIYNNSNFQTEFKNYLKKISTYENGDEIDLMGELHGVGHLDVQGGLEKLRKTADFYGYDSSKYFSDRVDFLKIHYHHGPAELDITVARWGEKTEWVDELVRNYVAVSSPGGRFQKTYMKLFKGTGVFGKGKFTKLTNRSRSFLRIREEMRSYSTRAYYLVRLGVLEFARRFEISEKDIFMYDMKEIRSKLLNENVALPDISKRQLFYQGYRHFKAPNEFGGSILARQNSMVDGQLKGLGCSPGEIVGTARVIFDIHATHALTKDDILITPFTDPGWTPVLARVGGVVTEVGGLLSHAAVIGREYGIPAILNLIDATKVIQDGDRVRINGKTGLVEVLEKGPKRHT